MASGNPAAVKSKKVYVYLVVGMLDVTPEEIDRGAYVPAEDLLPSVGTLIQREDFPGIGTHEFVFEDGPLKFIANAVFVATGEERPGDGGEQTWFDFGATRVLNLLALAQNAENVVKQQVHEFAGKVQERLEESPAGRDLAELVERVEREFWRA